jgi:hypothetical protein
LALCFRRCFIDGLFRFTNRDVEDSWQMMVLEICVGDRNASTLSMNKTLAPTTTEMTIASTMVLPRDRVDAAIVVAVLVLVILLDNQRDCVRRRRVTVGHRHGSVPVGAESFAVVGDGAPDDGQTLMGAIFDQ